MAKCTNKSIGRVPLCDEPVHGLYGLGLREMSPERQVAMNDAGEAIVPRLRDGTQEDTRGTIVLLCIGMSNASMTATALIRLANSMKSPRVKIVNACQFGQDLAILSDPNSAYWQSWVPSKLAQAGVTAAQVGAIWCMEGCKKPTSSSEIQRMWGEVYKLCFAKYVNARQLLVDAVNYMGYSEQADLSEPGGYEQGVALRDWVVGVGVQTRLVTAWGAYLWCDGEEFRRDGFNWMCPQDVMADGVHPSNPIGAEKLALAVLTRLTTMTETAVWFT